MGNRQLLASYSAGTGLLDHSQDRLFVTGNYGLDWAVQIGDSHVTGRPFAPFLGQVRFASEGGHCTWMIGLSRHQQPPYRCELD